MAEPSGPVPVQAGPIALSYAAGTGETGATSLWILLPLIPSVLAVFLNFTWTVSPWDVFVEVAESPGNLLHESGDANLAIVSLAIGVSLPVVLIPLALLPGRVNALIAPARFIALATAVVAGLAALYVAILLCSEWPTRAMEFCALFVYFAMLLAPLALLIRCMVRRRPSLMESSLFAITALYLALGMLCLIVFFDDPKEGYYVTAGAYPFHLIHGIQRTRRLLGLGRRGEQPNEQITGPV